jgi:hypothetical protein
MSSPIQSLGTRLCKVVWHDTTSYVEVPIRRVIAPWPARDQAIQDMTNK